MIDERIVRTPGGGILYDASRVRNPADALFERDHWLARRALEEVQGGRGSVSFLLAGDERWVLRHYRRGGWIAKIAQDRYAWRGESRTRAFVEWRLLVEINRLGLPAPAPIAARYARDGLTYRADLITQLVPSAHTLAKAITDQALPENAWRAVGRVIAAYHRAGVHHADLNAHNILLSEDTGARQPVLLLDFDRGRIRARGAWEHRVLGRLRRSLEKIKRERRGVVFAEREWRWLASAYRDADS